MSRLLGTRMRVLAGFMTPTLLCLTPPLSKTRPSPQQSLGDQKVARMGLPQGRNSQELFPLGTLCPLIIYPGWCVITSPGRSFRGLPGSHWLNPRHRCHLLKPLETRCSLTYARNKIWWAAGIIPLPSLGLHETNLSRCRLPTQSTGQLGSRDCPIIFLDHGVSWGMVLHRGVPGHPQCNPSSALYVIIRPT
ncbi:hypothetical protein BJX68DRAFT_217793 [Aspergillus pseudodeflectus]|uniref:Uncharacterized protein n=1 Tax=Aspergillus pseudodeflectus TaxID=176178 RepID=A0ABR4KTX2_9EURO